MSVRHESSSNQGSLFQERQTLSGVDPEHLTIRTEYEPIPFIPEAPKPVDGPSVNIKQRDNELSTTIDLKAEIATLAGLIISSETVEGRKKLEKRYGNKTDEVVDMAIAKKERKEKQVKEAAWRMGGYEDMVKSGLTSPAQATLEHQDDLISLGEKFDTHDSLGNKREDAPKNRAKKRREIAKRAN